MDLLIITRLLNWLLMIGLPVGLGVYLTRRFRLGWRLWWIGAATFVLSQVGHIPFNWILTRLFALGYGVDEIARANVRDYFAQSLALYCRERQRLNVADPQVVKWFRTTLWQAGFLLEET